MTRSEEKESVLVVVDTSVWIAYFRGGDPKVARNLDELIDADVVCILPPIRLELVLGCRKSQRASLVQRIDALHSSAIVESTWTLAEGFAMQLRDRGVTLGGVDALIAAAVSERRARLWSLDGDFDPLFRAKWIRPFRPS